MTRAAVDKSVEAITRDVARQGYAFSEVRPHGERDTDNHTIALSFTVDDGPKVYIERIDIVGNTRTRDYVIRREFDIGEGDPYNHVLIERAERRLNSLGYFKKVHITNRPGSAPDRVIVVVEVEDQPTGSISLSGGYSTTHGALAEACLHRDQLPRPRSICEAERLRRTIHPGLEGLVHRTLFPRPAVGRRLRHLPSGQQSITNTRSIETWTTGATLRLGIPITDDLTFQPNYSLYESKITIPNTSASALRRLRGTQSTWFPGGTPHPRRSRRATSTV